MHRGKSSSTHGGALQAHDLELKKLGRPENFKQAAFLGAKSLPVLQVGYNFLNSTSKRSFQGRTSTFSLVFYVIYTLWWGIAILFLFSEDRPRDEAGAKKRFRSRTGTRMSILPR